MRTLLFIALLSGCFDPVDARWQLDHDHVIAARATPPRIRAGEATDIDALVAREGGTVAVEDPMTAELAGDASSMFARYLVQDGERWRLEAPDAETLAGARPALGLPADAPVPVDVMLTFRRSDGENRAGLDPFRVKKTVWIGEPRLNPELPAVTIDDAPAGEEIVVPLERDVYVSVAAPPDMRVNWLTNVGTLFQDDVATAFLHVLPKDRRTGELVVVVRDAEGGVAWRVWPLRAE